VPANRGTNNKYTQYHDDFLHRRLDGSGPDQAALVTLPGLLCLWLQQ
jgi:hypothetical protein